MTPLRQQDVGGLDVTMDQALLVRRVEGIRHRSEDPDGLIDAQRAIVLEPLCERRSVDVAHRQVELSLPLPGRMDRDDVRVLEAGEELALAQESLAIRRVVDPFGGDEFQGNASVRLLLVSEIHDAHPTAGDDAVDPEASEHAAQFK